MICDQIDPGMVDVLQTDFLLDKLVLYFFLSKMLLKPHVFSVNVLDKSSQ